MATLKLKPNRATPARPAADRPPIRGSGTAPRPRPTLAQAQTERAERAARGPADRPPAPASRGDSAWGPRDDGRAPRDARSARDARDARDARAPRDVRDVRDRQASRDVRDLRDARNVHGAQASRDVRDARPARPASGPDDTRHRSPPTDSRRPAPDHSPRSDARADDPRPNVSRQARPLTPQRPGAMNESPPHPNDARHRAERARAERARPTAPRDDHRRGVGSPPPQRSDVDQRSAPFNQPARRHPNAADRQPRQTNSPDRDPSRHAAPASRADTLPPSRRSTPTPSTLPPTDDGIRLSKRMSALGIASRREADEWIPKGWVQVDGRVVDQLGARVRPEQRITVDARARFVQAQKVTVLLHKPLGYVSGQAEDGHAPASVLVQRDRQWHNDASGTRFLPTHLRGLAPAGRLDLDSTGLLVLTQDGRIARQLIGDDSAVEKEYRVQVTPSHGRPADAPVDLDLLRHGLELDGVPLAPAQVERGADGTLRFILREGRKRQIRRMCEAVGLQVVSLQRVRIGGVQLGDLPPGQWRYLRGDEAFAPLSPASSTPPASSTVEP